MIVELTDEEASVLDALLPPVPDSHMPQVEADVHSDPDLAWLAERIDRRRAEVATCHQSLTA